MVQTPDYFMRMIVGDLAAMLALERGAVAELQEKLANAEKEIERLRVELAKT